MAIPLHPEARAHALLREFRATLDDPDPWRLIPVPLDGIAAHLGWDVAYVRNLWAGGDEMAGEIAPGARIVTVSRKWPVEVQRFTLAHELGHAVLHPGVVAHRDPPMYGDEGRQCRTLSPQEKEANRFAAELLMPRRAVRQYFLELFGVRSLVLSELTEDFVWHLESSRGRRSSRLGPTDMTVRDLSEVLAHAKHFQDRHFGWSLAERFQVSVLAAAIRLEELGIVVA